MKCFAIFLSVFFLLTSTRGLAQKSNAPKNNPLVYIDKNGVLRWKSNNTEASFFGVNYTVPFAYSYRAHKALNVDLEKAIQQDVYHMARLGLDAFRVHVWDTEISDVAGKLLENDHLRLFDFLLAELKRRNIKTIITPIAFWGNGYPERDENTPGFSRFYGRAKLTTNDSAIRAQENYVRQFFSHINPYTKLAYKDDPDVIAVEINNEPSHSGPKNGVTNYINRLAAAIKSTGWSKPLFYNISQGPYYADAVAASVVNGFSFQWYPTGLVSGNELRGNYLPHVDKYLIPFDTIPAFAKKVLMIYEFDAADILQSDIYPAMARSFREAGFQWATQFSYDPMALAYANTEYQTHYLNLAYTPSKAISLLIASKVFHKIPRLKNYGAYPADTVFDVFRVSYKEGLSEMNSDEEFYYTNSTGTKPVNVSKLQHIAGVGRSSVVKYNGLGAYFLDKLEDGVWRVEVMPDAVYIRDPFEKASPGKEVTRIQWRSYPIQIAIPDLGRDFSVKGLNEGNNFFAESSPLGFQVSPGSYLLTAKGKKLSGGNSNVGTVGLNEFVAPRQTNTEMYLFHEPFTEVSSGKPITLKANAVGIDTGSVSVQINQSYGRFKIIPMTRKSPSCFVAEIPADMLAPGILNYKIILRKGNDVSVFPGNFKGNPFAWDNYHNETWKTYVAAPNGGLELFNPTIDRVMRTYPAFRRGFQTNFITGEKPEQLILSMTANDLSVVKIMGFQFSLADKLKGRIEEMGSFDKLIARLRTSNTKPVKAKVALIFSDGSSVSSVVSLTNDFTDLEIPLNSMISDSTLLLPRPFPAFLPLAFKANRLSSQVNLSDAQKIEVTIGSGIPISDLKKTYNLDVERIWLQKAKIETNASYEIVVTPNRTTLIADGKDAAIINISVVDRQGREVTNAGNSIKFTCMGDAKIIKVSNDDPNSNEPDQFSVDSLWQRSLFNGKCRVVLQAGKKIDKIKFEAKSKGLQTGSTGIHTIHPGLPHPVASNTKKSARPVVDRMIGADISFLPQLEARGMKFSDNGIEKDAIQILKDHGFNYVRLRIFHNPAADSGYSPKRGFCDLEHTKQMAKRVKTAGMKLLLDFHYSDYWADPEKQYKPAAWRKLGFPLLSDSVETYTKKVVKALADQGTVPDMVQIGNEINHGMIWPEGHIGNLDSLAQLIQAGVNGVKSVDPSIAIMLHIALGGQHDEAVFFLDNMIARNVQFDVIGISYYPKWHGTLDDLRNNLTGIANRYGQDIIVVEYSQKKREVHDIVFSLPNGKGKGTAIWEPLNTWESVFDRQGNSNNFMMVYDEMSKKFIARSQ
jgi:arabinogalactan endo-1,4-beta-galactosidase